MSDRLPAPPKTGWPAGLMQDDCSGLSKWLASRIDAREVVRRNLSQRVRQGHRYTHNNRSVLAMETGEGLVKVSEIDMSRVYPYCPTEVVDSAELVPEPMRYIHGTMP